MSRLIIPVCIVSVLLGSTSSEGQRHRVIPQPPAPANTQTTTSVEPPQKKRLDALQIQREALELSDLAKSIPLDIEHVNKGLMPKDMVEKLKRIEKLSKHLRREVTF
jgi:hypothetical protein